MRICQMLKPPMGNSLRQVSSLPPLRFPVEARDRPVDRVEQPRSLEIVDARQIAAEPRPKCVRNSASSHRAAAGPGPPPAGRPDPARLHQHVERALRDLDAADRLDLGAADRLVIGDDRQRLGRRARQPPRLLARPAEQMREIGRGLEMPAPAALDQLDPAAGIMRRRAGRARSRHRPRRHARRSPRRVSGSAEANKVASTARIELVHHAALQLERRERLLLRDLDPAAPRQLERREEARGQRRPAELRVLRLGQEAFEQAPVERRADHPPDPLDRLLQRHHRARMDDVHRRLGARPDRAIGREQIEVGTCQTALRTTAAPRARRAGRRRGRAGRGRSAGRRPRASHRAAGGAAEAAARSPPGSGRSGSLGSSRQDLR